MDEDTQREKRQRDFDDAQNEAAGRDTGKMRRFVTEDRSPKAVARRNQIFWNDLLMITIQSERIRERLEELDRATEHALRVAERRAKEAHERLEELQKGASTDENGKRVYRSADGKRAYDETGRQLSAPEQARVQWKSGAPAWEEYRDADSRFQGAVRELEEIKTYREKLQQGQKKLDAREDLDGLEKDLETMPAGVQAQLGKRGAMDRPSGQPEKIFSAAHEYLKDDPLPSAPDLSAAFAAVRNPPRSEPAADVPTLDF